MAARGELVSDRDLDARIAVQALTGPATQAGLAAEDSSPAGEQVLIVANITGRVYALNLATGRPSGRSNRIRRATGPRPPSRRARFTSRPRTASH